MLDLPIRHQQPHFEVVVWHLLRRAIEFTLHHEAIVGMGPLNDQADRRSDAAVKAQNFIGLFRPEVMTGGDIPGKAAGLAELLRLGRIGLAPLPRVFNLLAIIDVDIGTIPGNDGSGLIPQSLATEQKPAICPIEAPHARLDIVGFAGFKHSQPCVMQRRPVVGMNRSPPFPTQRLLLGKAGVIEPALVEIFGIAVGSGAPGENRNQIKRAPKLTFGLGELGLAAPQRFLGILLAPRRQSRPNTI